MRVVLDTNVIIAGMAYPAGPPGRIVAAWRSGSLSVSLSPWILAECERVLPRLRRFSALSPVAIRDLVDGLAFAAELVEPAPESLQRAADAALRDVADEPVLATLMASGAEALVSGDKDLLALADRFAVISPADFCVRFLP